MFGAHLCVAEKIRRRRRGGEKKTLVPNEARRRRDNRETNQIDLETTEQNNFI